MDVCLFWLKMIRCSAVIAEFLPDSIQILMKKYLEKPNETLLCDLSHFIRYDLVIIFVENLERKRGVICSFTNFS